MNTKISKKNKLIQEKIIETMTSAMNVNCISSTIDKFDNQDYKLFKNVFTKPDGSTFSLNVYYNKYDNTIHLYSTEIEPVRSFFKQSLCKDFIEDASIIYKDLTSIFDKWNITESFTLDPNTIIKVAKKKLQIYTSNYSQNLYTLDTSCIGSIKYNKSIYRSLIVKADSANILTLPKLIFENGEIKAFHTIRFTIKEIFNNIALDYYPSRDFKNKDEFKEAIRMNSWRLNGFCKGVLAHNIHRVFKNYSEKELLNKDSKEMVELGNMIEICNY